MSTNPPFWSYGINTESEKLENNILLSFGMFRLYSKLLSEIPLMETLVRVPFFISTQAVVSSGRSTEEREEVFIGV